VSPSDEETLRRIDRTALRDTTQLLVKIANSLMKRLETTQFAEELADSDMQNLLDGPRAENDNESPLSPPLPGAD
jgi:hypothetical protein